jgi:GBP family porin
LDSANRPRNRARIAGNSQLSEYRSMKKTLLGAALMGAFSASAHAQSSVTLYGLIDAGMTYSSNQGGHNDFQQSSGLVSNTVFGLRGSEDLGGGLHAIFRLENGFNINNGSNYFSNGMFGRQAYVGLQSNQYGQVTLGRQYDSVVDYLGPISLANFGDGNNLAAHPFDNDNLDDFFSINNAIKYTSPTYAGLTFGGLYGFSNQAGGFSNNRAYSFGASYSNGPFNLAAAYMQLMNAGSNATGALSSTDNSTNIASGRQTVFGVGGNYAFGPATVGLLWTHTQFNNATGGGALSAFSGPTTLGNMDLHLDNFEVNGHYALTSALSLNGAYTFTEGAYNSANGSGNPHWHQVTLQSDYSLSKRTDMYLEGVYQHVSAPVGSVFSGAVINGLSPSTSNSQVAATVGIRHRF